MESELRSHRPTTRAFLKTKRYSLRASKCFHQCPLSKRRKLEKGRIRKKKISTSKCDSTNASATPSQSRKRKALFDHSQNAPKKMKKCKQEPPKSNKGDSVETPKSKCENPDDSKDSDDEETSSNVHSSSETDCCTICFVELCKAQSSEESLINGLTEEIALFKEGMELTHSSEDLLQCNITDFSIYDKNGHLCSMSNNLIEMGVELFACGYITPTKESLREMEPVPVQDIGPITEWAVEGYDGKENNYFVITTEMGEYRLREPNERYMPYMSLMYEKKEISKLVIEFLEANDHLNPTYSQLLHAIEMKVIPETNENITEEMLKRNADYLCQVASTFDEEDGEMSLISLPCMRDLVKISGIKIIKTKKQKITENKKVKLPNVKKSERNMKNKSFVEDGNSLELNNKWSKATTTPLVRKYFENLFQKELDNSDISGRDLNKPCGICERCQRPDCGKCTNCKEMAKYGGYGTTAKCKRRVCLQNEKIMCEDEEVIQKCMDLEQHKKIRFAILKDKCIEWIGENTPKNNCLYYEKVKVAGTVYKVGDFVTLKTLEDDVPSMIARIVYFYKDCTQPGLGYFHGQLLMRSSDTILGETGNPREVYLTDNCYHKIPLVSIINQATISNKSAFEASKNITKNGQIEKSEEKDDGKNYFYGKFYSKFTARFEDIPPDLDCIGEGKHRNICPSCQRKTIQELQYAPRVCGKLKEKPLCENGIKETYWESVQYKNYDYTKGCCVFLNPNAYTIEDNFRKQSKDAPSPEPKVDKNKYPEFHRKKLKREFNLTTCCSYQIGQIEEIIAHGWGPLIDPQDIYINIRVMYRPENTKCRTPQHEDLNKVYWSDHIEMIPFKYVVAPCQVYFEGNIPDKLSPKDWLEEDASRFYFNTAYDHVNKKFSKLSQEALSVGGCCVKSTNGDPKKITKGSESSMTEQPKVHELVSLDLFAGCGGLTDGLHQAGLTNCKWAIENDQAAAKAFAENNQNCTVICDDVNSVLRDIMDGTVRSKNGQVYPKKGKVELICGGPPCQGFSGMNRYNTRAYSTFKNSLIVTFLSYCDYFRPKYIIMENVRNFVLFEKGLAVKLSLNCLLTMGYQCTFAVLQAGCYGIPQTRRRVILLASAPGYKLPLYPEPTSVFNRIGCRVSVQIDAKYFTNNIETYKWAPRRSCTIYDALSDLPEIESGASALEMNYASPPQTHFQRIVRSKEKNAPLTDHICKAWSPLVQARIELIPKTPGADWRDLPNIKVKLSDGTETKVLKYKDYNNKQKNSKAGSERGVCPCVSGDMCDPKSKQDNTLIPWGMAHTANRNNNWCGIYGRLSSDNYFRTTVTDPEPSGTQGRVLHPEQDRVVSVRECARSQGFRDTFIFSGSIQDKHRQIGNAVPPPLATAIGRAIKKALQESNQQSDNQ